MHGPPDARRTPPCRRAKSGVAAAASPRVARSPEHTDLAMERHGGRPPAGALPARAASRVRARAQTEATVLCAEDDDGRCLDGAPSLLQAVLPFLASPDGPPLAGGGLTAAYCGQGWTVFHLPSSPREAEGRPTRIARPGYIL